LSGVIRQAWLKSGLIGATIQCHSATGARGPCAPLHTYCCT